MLYHSALPSSSSSSANNNNNNKFTLLADLRRGADGGHVRRACNDSGLWMHPKVAVADMMTQLNLYVERGKIMISIVHHCMNKSTRTMA
jgi:hypothetical protein